MDKPPRARASRPSRWVSLLVVMGVAQVGCAHATLEQRPDLRDELAHVSAEDLFREGLVYAHRGDMLRAEQYLNAARDRGYDEAEVVAWLVRICITSNRYQSALTHAATYLRAHPSDWSLRFVIANIHDALGDAARAQAELEAVVQAAPDRPLPHYRLALLYRERLADEEKSRAHFEEYLRLDPGGAHAAEVRSALASSDVVSRGPQLVPPPERLTLVDGEQP